MQEKRAGMQYDKFAGCMKRNFRGLKAPQHHDEPGGFRFRDWFRVRLCIKSGADAEEKSS